MSSSKLPAYPNEIDYPGPVGQDSTIMSFDQRRVQEWLTLSGYALELDGDFGPISKATLRRYQQVMRLPQTGFLDVATWNVLANPLIDACLFEPSQTLDLGGSVLQVAQRWVKWKPVELNGNNQGPWVRQCTKGYEVAWCLGTASTCVEQACLATGTAFPLPIYVENLWCLYVPRFVDECKKINRFVDGRDVNVAEKVRPGNYWFVRAGGTYPHTGLVVSLNGDTVVTIEGNTNTDGSVNGWQMIQRTRRTSDLDFAYF